MKTRKKILIVASIFAMLGFALTLTTNIITQSSVQPTIIEANDAPPIDQPKLPL
jgi:hypothetical protein